MNIGSTPTNVFVVPSDIDLTDYKEIQVVYSQNCMPIIIKDTLDAGSDISVSGQNIMVTLTQEDTFKLSGNPTPALKIQVRIMLSDDTVLASNYVNTSVLECLDTKILNGEA